MDYIKDFIYVNKETINKSARGLRENLLFLAVGVIFYIIELVASYIIGLLVAGPTSILSGFINAFVRSAIYSSYLYILFNIINYRRFRFSDIKTGFSHFLWKVYGVFFIMYIAQLILGLLGNLLGTAANILNILILLTAFIVFNALPEAIYLKDYRPMDTLTYTMDFIKENWLNWFIPNIIFGAVLFLLGVRQFGTIFSPSLINNPYAALITMVPALVIRIVFSVFMLYRGFLFKLLSTSTRRKRMFMNR